jgi:hypothetical protein
MLLFATHNFHFEDQQMQVITDGGTLNPEIKIEAARMAMVRDLCRVFSILVPSEW